MTVPGPAASPSDPQPRRRLPGWLDDRGPGHERFGLVLILILVGFLLSGSESATLSRVVVSAINAVILVLVFRETGLAHSGRRVASLVAIGIASFLFVSGVDGRAPEGGVAWLFQAAITLAVAVAIIARILQHRRVGIQTVFGAVCVYVLVGMVFGAVYSGLQSILGPEVLQANDGGEVDPLYYSFVTLTTLGFGDITSPEVLVRRITVIEAMFGQLFLATMVARLVSMFGGERPSVSDPVR